ncbi:MAG: hypothetical protein Q8O62_05770 [Aequorivita sp.]|nr:hypothetical protein [Aequorivita sp.]
MGQKKDIGQFFETKLNAGKKIPNESIWEKINASLDEEKRKRKRLLLYWWLGGGISFLLGLFLLFGIGKFLNTHSQIPLENNSLEQKPFSTSDKEHNDETIKISEDSLKSKNIDDEKLSKIETENEHKTLNNTGNPSKKVSEKERQKSSSKRKSIDETYTVSEKYYYYNSKDGKQIVTNNKNEIDSLISKQYKSLDSTKTKKNESPAE